MATNLLRLTTSNLTFILIIIQVWVMSLPVVVIVHGNQEPQSWATITWDNAFSEISRVPFHVVDKVNWSHMVSALNMKFTCQTGRGLTAENLYYLCELMNHTIAWTLSI